MPTLSSRRRPWPWDLRLSLADLPVEEPHTIGDFRPNTIGELRPRLIGSLRAASAGKIFRQGLMLVPQGQGAGLLVGKKQTPLSPYFPPAQDYDSSPLYHERTFMFKPGGGMGESVQSSSTDKRYHYAMDCWVTGGLFGKGPLTHQIVPPSTRADPPLRRSPQSRRFSGLLSRGPVSAVPQRRHQYWPGRRRHSRRRDSHGCATLQGSLSQRGGRAVRRVE